jgi:CHAD domain-containing protein
VRAIFKRLPKGLAGDPVAIHDMRVAGRRLQVAISLLAKKPEGKRAKRALRVLRDLTKAAGASRDLDVCLDLLNAHLREQDVSSREALALRRRLRTARARSRAQMAEALLDLEIARLRRDLRKLLARKADGLFAILGRIRATREEEGQGLLEGFRGLGDRYDPEALHALRRQARRLRYTAEVHDALKGGGGPSDAPALFKLLQEQIGALHDVHVLARWLEAQARAATERGQTAETEAAGALQAAFEGKARELHRTLLEAEPSAIALRALLALGRRRSVA